MLVRGRMPELVRHFDDIDFSVDMVSERRFDCGGDVGDVFFFFFFLIPWWGGKKNPVTFK